MACSVQLVVTLDLMEDIVSFRLTGIHDAVCFEKGQSMSVDAHVEADIIDGVLQGKRQSQIITSAVACAAHRKIKRDEELGRFLGVHTLTDPRDTPVKPDREPTPRTKGARLPTVPANGLVGVYLSPRRHGAVDLTASSPLRTESLVARPHSRHHHVTRTQTPVMMHSDACGSTLGEAGPTAPFLASLPAANLMTPHPSEAPPSDTPADIAHNSSALTLSEREEMEAALALFESASASSAASVSSAESSELLTSHHPAASASSVTEVGSHGLVSLTTATVSSAASDSPRRDIIDVLATHYSQGAKGEFMWQFLADLDVPPVVSPLFWNIAGVAESLVKTVGARVHKYKSVTQSAIA